jgi:DNA-binding HxlR family transcriptional regulator
MSREPIRSDDCNVAYAMSFIGGKWKIAIIWKLMGERLRYSKLRTQLGRISEGVLINQLKELEADGLIRRIDFKEVPPHVEYELTNEGRQLEAALRKVETWGAVRRASLHRTRGT